MTPFQMEILPRDLVYACGHLSVGTNLQEDKWDGAIHLKLITSQARRVKWTRVVNESFFIRLCVCVLLLSSGKCQTWCWLIPSQRTFLKRTSGRSTGEFVVEGFRGLSRKKKKKVKMQRREREDGNMSKKQKLGRDVEWERRLRKEERGKGSEKDDNSSEGQRGGR